MAADQACIYDTNMRVRPSFHNISPEMSLFTFIDSCGNFRSVGWHDVIQQKYSLNSTGISLKNHKELYSEQLHEYKQKNMETTSNMSNSWEAERLRGRCDGRAKVERRSGIPFDWRKELEETGSSSFVLKNTTATNRRVRKTERRWPKWLKDAYEHLVVQSLNKIFTSNLYNHFFTWLIHAQIFFITFQSDTDLVLYHHGSLMSSHHFLFSRELFWNDAIHLKNSLHLCPGGDKLPFNMKPTWWDLWVKVRHRLTKADQSTEIHK